MSQLFAAALAAGNIVPRDIASDKYGGRMGATVSADGKGVAEILTREGLGHPLP